MVRVTLASDDRARVPFALVGVVLLVSSAAYTGVLVTRDPVSPRTPTERATATATTAAHATLEQATLSASATASATPLTTPADTPMGRTLVGPDPFERYLRLLVYRNARRGFDNVSATAGRTTVDPGLKPIETPADARVAIDRTTVDPVDDGRRLRVTIRNVSFAISRDGGAVVANHQRTLSVVAATPILALHRRTTEFDTRLDTDPLEGPGLGRWLTAGLLVTAQTRGLAQYAEAPITNVLANRHVELQTNVAALAQQRRAFGHADPESVGSVVWATGRVGLHDGLAMATTRQERWSERVLRSPQLATPSAATATLTTTDSPTRSRAAAPNQTADRALVAVTGTGPGTVEAAVQQAYSIDTRLITATNRISRTTETDGSRPPGAIPVSTDSTTTRTVDPPDRTDSDAPSISDRNGDHHLDTPRGYRLVATDSRRVTDSRTTVTVWQTTNGTTRTVETRTTVSRVTLGVATHYSPAPAPVRPVETTRARRQLDAAAIDAVLGGSSHRDALAEAVVEGRAETASRTVAIGPPRAAVDAARAAVLGAHRRTRRLTASVTQNGTLDSTPPAELNEVFDANRSRLLDAPARYEGPAHVAEVAARETYLDAVADELETDTNRVSRAQTAVRSLLAERGLGVPVVGQRVVPNRSATGVSVAVTPDYLPVTEVTPRLADIDSAYYPLAARNVNLFTVPYGDAADGVAASVVPNPPGRVDLAVAARTLAASNDDALTENDSLLAERRRLRAHVADATEAVAAAQLRVLARETSLTTGESQALVADTLDTYPTVATRAEAVTNGSVSQALARHAASRIRQNTTVLEARLRVATAAARREPGARVPEESANGTASAARAVAREAVTVLAERASQRAVDHVRQRAADRVEQRALAKAVADLPAGLPVAPLPGSWYATVNVWIVDVRGAYHRVEATSTVASPAVGPDGLTYTREAESVEFDLTGDGSLDRLGRVEPVAFDVQTAVIVVVPAGAQGVGDTSGDVDERSPGWPGPAAALNSTNHGSAGAGDGGRNETGTTPPSIGSP